MTTRTDLARAAFYNSNPALMDHLYEMDEQLTVDTPPDATLGMDLSRAIELMEGMSEQEFKDLVTLGIIEQPAPTVTKRIGSYDPVTKDFPAFVIFEDGHEEYIGSRPTQHDASLLASDYIIQWYSDNHTPEKAAQLIHDELAQEGRHAQAAADQGGEWVTGECWEEIGAPDQDELREWAKADEAPDGCTATDLNGGDPETIDEYSAFIAADDAWQAGLERVFGRKAGDARYTAEGRTGPTLAPLYAEFRRTCAAWHAKQEAARSNPPPPATTDEVGMALLGVLRRSEELKAEPPPPATDQGKVWGTAYTGCWCRGEGCYYCEHFSTMDEVVELAYAMRQVPLAGEGRYCRNCQGPHHIQRCPEIGMLLLPGPLPGGDPQACPSCGDASAGLCNACRETGERRTEIGPNQLLWAV